MQHVTTVYIIDDDQAVRDAISDLVEGMGLTAESYANAEDFLDSYKHCDTGCMVLDVRMPGMSGLDLQARMASMDINLPIVFITGHGDVPMAVKAMKNGAVDFIEKPFREQALWDCIRKALDHSYELCEHNNKRREVKKKYDLLTEREKQVLNFILEGFSDKEAAHELNVTQRAIAFHRNNILKKMRTSSVVELVNKVNTFCPVEHKQPDIESNITSS